jgi:hypothetical protein
LHGIEDEIRIRGLEAFNVGGACSVLYSRDVGAFLAESAITRLLGLCTAFRTLDQHLRCIAQAQRLDSGRIDILRVALQEMVDAGLFLRKSKLLESARANRSKQPLLRVSTIGILTRGRVGTVGGVIESYAQNARLFGRCLDFTLFTHSGEDWTGFIGSMRSRGT